jgi:hypothetical protein
MIQSRKNLVGIGFICLTGSLAFLFQNCGSMSPSATAVLNQSTTEVQYSNDQAALLRLLNSTSFQTWISAAQSVSALPAGSAVSAAISLLPSAMNLSPAASTSGPTMATSSSLSPNSIFNFSAAQNLTTGAQMFFSNSVSVIMLVEGSSATGKIATINDGTSGSHEFGINLSSGSATFTQQTSSGDGAAVSAGLPSSQDFIVAVSFGKSSTDINSQLNGSITGTAPTVAGAGDDSIYIPRQLTLGDASVASGFKVAEMMVYSNQLSAPELNTLTRYMAKKWNVPAPMGYVPYSISQPATSASDPLPPDVAAIISICVGCHVGYHNAWASLEVSDLTQPQWVVPGSASSSAVISETTSGNMPQGLTPLTSAQISTLTTWINSL